MRKWKSVLAWLSGLFLLYLCVGLASAIPVTKKNMIAMPDTSLLRLSGELLYRVKTEEPTGILEEKLAGLDMEQLINGLNNDEAIKTFWLNMYNAWFQILAGREKMKRPGIFTEKRITIAGRKFSLDNIEHDILRKYRWKYSMGYLPRFFPGRVLKQLAVNKIDYRIHFAMNCGARSCPPIAFYQYENINRQLDLAAQNFIQSETTVDDTKKEITTSKILSWFRGDFGGKKGIRQVVGNAFEKDLRGYRIRFNDYDWTSVLKNYSE